MTGSAWTPIVVAHASLAALAVLLGALLLWGRKGQRAHRVGGWLWVITMAAVAVSSFAIQRPQGLSWIHGLSIFTLITLATGVALARAHRVKGHRINMLSLYFGGLVLTGLFTFLPGRLLGEAVRRMVGW